jgi:hypothetical protein
MDGSLCREQLNWIVLSQYSGKSGPTPVRSNAIAQPARQPTNQSPFPNHRTDYCIARAVQAGELRADRRRW